VSSKSPKIKDLCEQISRANESELAGLMAELRKTLQEHYEETRKLMTASYPLRRQKPSDRDSSKEEESNSK